VGETRIKRRVQCPQCAEKFYAISVWGCCPHCGYEAEEPDDTVISLPAIRAATTKATDKVYRDMETASIHRAEQAAAMAGVPVSEMSHLKITNLRDNVQNGETYAMPPPPNNPVTQQMELMKQRGMPVGFIGNPNVGTGPTDAARSGGRVLDAINPNSRANPLGATFK